MGERVDGHQEQGGIVEAHMPFLIWLPYIFASAMLDVAARPLIETNRDPAPDPAGAQHLPASRSHRLTGK
jgi:hypothetical protein